MQTNRLKFRKGDLLAIGAVIILALVIFLCYLPQNAEPAGQAEIYLNGQKIKTVDLTVDQTFTVENRYRNVICVKDGAILIAESNCPGQDCVHSGRISTHGRIIVCLPNGLEIRVTDALMDTDFVVG